MFVRAKADRSFPSAAELAAAARAFSLAGAMAIVLQGCGPSPPPEPRPSAQALADSLNYAISEFCVPYVVDGVDEGRLTQRPDATPVHYNVHGKDVLAYRLDRAGKPEITFSDQYCDVRMKPFNAEESQQVEALSWTGLELGQRKMSEPVERVTPTDRAGVRHWLCIYGTSAALLQNTYTEDQILSTVETGFEDECPSEPSASR